MDLKSSCVSGSVFFVYADVNLFIKNRVIGEYIVYALYFQYIFDAYYFKGAISILLAVKKMGYITLLTFEYSFDIFLCKYIEKYTSPPMPRQAIGVSVRVIYIYIRR